MITRSDVMGGASIHLLDLASGLKNAGHEVVIYVGGSGILLEKAKDKNIECISLIHMKREINFVSDMLCFFELRSHLIKSSPDIVHLHSSKAGILGRLVAKYLAIPSVFTAHGWAFTEGVTEHRRKLYIIIERFIARITGKIITVSNYDLKLALKSGVGDEGKIISIHNGMPDIVRGYNLIRNNDCVRFIMVARFDHPKDQRLLIEAFSYLKEKNWMLELVGDGPFLNDAIETAQKFDLTDQIVFSGDCNDVADRLAASDVFCLISNWEGLPLTIIEAMRSGLPVIASSVGGVPELVEEGNTGLLVQRGNLNSLVNAIDLLLGSGEKRKSLGRKGRALFEEKFMFELMLDKNIKVYEELLSSRV